MEQTNTNEEPKQELNPDESNEITWETNHEKITEALRYLQRKEVKPTVSNIAKLTKLSRKTVANHINQDGTSLIRKSYSNVNRFMLDEVVERICRKACFGDLKAAQLYLELMGVIERSRGKINTNILNHNNTVMVKGQALTDEVVQNLSAENLTQLEEFVKAALQRAEQESTHLR